VAGQISHWRLIEASSRVNVDRVGDVFGWFRLIYGRVESLVLSRGREKQTSIGRESQTSKE
jgi:hypothetical protein